MESYDYAKALITKVLQGMLVGGLGTKEAVHLVSHTGYPIEFY